MKESRPTPISITNAANVQPHLRRAIPAIVSGTIPIAAPYSFIDGDDHDQAPISANDCETRFAANELHRFTDCLSPNQARAL
jgi:hypothetical protein